MQCLLQRYILLAKILKTEYIAQAACDHIKDWYSGTKAGEWVSVLIYLNDGMNVHHFQMAVPSDGSNWCLCLQ